jgi:hypothetical protein
MDLLFKPGRTLITPNAQSKLSPVEVAKAMGRHLSGDWGDVCQDDWRENELSLKEGFRLFSAYHDGAGTKFWIITEADRSATTVLLPEDY